MAKSRTTFRAGESKTVAAGRKGAKASPWSKYPMVDSDKAWKGHGLKKAKRPPGEG